MVEMVKTILNGEFEIILPKHRADRPEWKLENGGWEKKRLQSMHENIGKGDIVFYVGSEEGEMPALCQMWGAQVVLFEPNDRVWPNTGAIWEANSLTPPLMSFTGFAANEDYRPDVLIKGFPPQIKGDIIGDHGFKELIDPGDIPQIKIDTIVNQTGIIPTAISLDVEGSEGQVLRGAEQTLKNHHPKIWLSLHPEFLIMNYKEYSRDLRRWIKDLGYKETFLEWEHEAHFFYI